MCAAQNPLRGEHGVRVWLKQASNPSVIFATTTTDATGAYLFASWLESVDGFGFRKVTKVMIQDELEDFKGTMPVTAA